MIKLNSFNNELIFGLFAASLSVSLLTGCDKDSDITLQENFENSTNYTVELEPVKPEPTKEKVVNTEPKAREEIAKDLIATDNSKKNTVAINKVKENNGALDSKKVITHNNNKNINSSTLNGSVYTVPLLTNNELILKNSQAMANNAPSTNSSRVPNNQLYQQKPALNDNANPFDINNQAYMNQGLDGQNRQQVNPQGVNQHTHSPYNEQGIDQQPKTVVGDQVTTVNYSSQAGKKLKTVFYTSLTGDMSATVTLDSGQQVQLKAEYEGGNNPVYSSHDRSIEMITYGGGGSIDLIVNGQTIPFSAVSANAEVVANKRF